MLKEIAKSTLVYAAGDVLAKLLAFVVIPVLTAHLSVAEYGLWGLINVAISLANGIVVLGLDSAFMRYFFDAKNDEEKKVVTSTCLFTAVVWGFLAIGLITFFSAQVASAATGSSKNEILIRIALLSSPLFVLNTVCAQALRNQLKAFHYAAASIGFAVVSAAFLIAGVILYGITGAVAAMVAGHLVYFPIRIFMIRKLVGFKIDFGLIKKLLAMGVPMVPASIAYWVFMLSDRIIIDNFAGREEVGYYTLANNIAGPMILLYNALGLAWSPHALKMYTDDRERSRSEFGKYCLVFSAIFSVAAVLLSCFSIELVYILGRGNFERAIYVIAPIALSYVCYSITQISALGISIAKKTYYFAIYSWVIAGLNVTLNLLFVPKYGIIASAWSTFASTILLNLLYAFTSNRFFSVRYPLGSLAAVVIMSAAVCSLLPHFFNEISGLSIVVRMGVVALYIAFLFVVGIPRTAKELQHSRPVLADTRQG